MTQVGDWLLRGGVGKKVGETLRKRGGAGLKGGLQ